MRKLVWKLLSILMMILIFWFSNQNASASNLQSGWFYHLFHGHIQLFVSIMHKKNQLLKQRLGSLSFMLVQMNSINSLFRVEVAVPSM